METRLIKFIHLCRKTVKVIEYKENTQMLRTTTGLSALTYSNEEGLLILQKVLSLQEAR
jgi:phage gp16-like protein